MATQTDLIESQFVVTPEFNTVFQDFADLCGYQNSADLAGLYIVEHLPLIVPDNREQIDRLARSARQTFGTMMGTQGKSPLEGLDYRVPREVFSELCCVSILTRKKLGACAFTLAAHGLKLQLKDTGFEHELLKN